MTRRKVLFLSEAVTLAHLVRPYLLARSLDTRHYDVILASAGHYDSAIDDAEVKRARIYSRSPQEFATVLAKGSILFEEALISRYVKDELEFFEAEKPDLVVGDFRPSLAVSCEALDIPFMTLTNAYWSPYALDVEFPFPCLDVIRKSPLRGSLGNLVTRGLSALSRPKLPQILEAQGAGVNAVRKKFNLPVFNDYLTGFTYGTHTMYADVPLVVPTDEARRPATHSYIGPLIWSPTHSFPEWWDNIEVSTAAPLAYVSLGSSGIHELLTPVLETLLAEGFTVLASCGGKSQPAFRHPRLFLADYLPGDAAAAKASLVICNGGSPSVYQSLRAGAPVIGIPGNMDQLAFMSQIEKRNLGSSVRSDIFSKTLLRRAIRSSAALPASGREEVVRELREFDAAANFQKTLAHLLNEKDTYVRVHNM